MGIHLPRTPIPATLKQRICNLYKASEIGALRVRAKPRRPSAPLSLCFPPRSLPADPIRATAIAIAVRIYRAVPANSEPGTFKVPGSFPRQLGRR